MLVIDLSGLLGFIFLDERTPFTDALERAIQSDETLAPEFLKLEAGNVLWTQEKRRRFSPATVDAFLRDIEAMNIRYIRMNDAWSAPALLLQLQRRYTLTSYDALYLALAIHRACPLATTDQALAAAADAEGLLWQP